MSSWEFVLILVMTAVTFGVRYPVLALVSRLQIPPAIDRALRYIPPAVLAAIIAPALLMPDGGTLSLRLDNAALVAGTAAGLIAWRTRNLLLTIVAGMLIFWGWRWLMGVV
jgi:branched-subunit amino acid transport protein